MARVGGVLFCFSNIASRYTNVTFGAVTVKSLAVASSLSTVFVLYIALLLIVHMMYCKLVSTASFLWTWNAIAKVNYY